MRLFHAWAAALNLAARRKWHSPPQHPAGAAIGAAHRCSRASADSNKCRRSRHARCSSAAAWHSSADKTVQLPTGLDSWPYCRLIPPLLQKNTRCRLRWFRCQKAANLRLWQRQQPAAKQPRGKGLQRGQRKYARHIQGKRNRFLSSIVERVDRRDAVPISQYHRYALRGWLNRDMGCPGKFQKYFCGAMLWHLLPKHAGQHKHQ